MAYQGWKNWETWNVALWFGNDEGLYNAVRDHHRRFDAGDAEEFVWDLLPDGTPDFQKDSTSRRDVAKAYGQVDWQEIADSFNEMRGEEDEAEVGESRVEASKPASFRPSSIESAYDEAVAFMAGREVKNVNGPNTTMYADLAHKGPVIVRYHGNIIVTYEPGTIALNSQGYRTYTTKERLNWFLPHGWSVYQAQHKWFVHGPSRKLSFEDGMILTGSGHTAHEAHEAHRPRRPTRAVNQNVYWRDIPAGSRVELIGHAYYATFPDGTRASVYWEGRESAEAQRVLDRMAGVGPTPRRATPPARRQLHARRRAPARRSR